MLRFDAAIARYASTTIHNGTVEMFMPWPREEQPAPASADAVLAFLTASVKKKN